MDQGDEVSAIRAAFDEFDLNKSGAIEVNELGALMARIGKDDSEAEAVISCIDPDSNGAISFEEFMVMLQAKNENSDACDPKVLEFLKILSKYREKCESEGNYLEAARATKQLDTLRKQEEKRQHKALKARQLSERQDVQIAHNMQFAEFNAAWDKYIEEYDQMAQMYIKQMTERHAQQLTEFQEDMREKMARKPPKFSRELLDWRQRQHMLAKQKKYAEAERIKRVADEMEQREREKMLEDQQHSVKVKEAKFHKQQQSELQALLKRIDGRRKEHLKQRALDSKRLLQRNKNVQAVLSSKQTTEADQRKNQIKTELKPVESRRGPTRNTDTYRTTKRTKKTRKSKS
eukprot:TRINITY_DN778432_c0_g1_i1.p1 TRINITY_DN778432_c0_g1~~TRINITY_DN778432_c0_g1_i1.p1  ORF type:complete len:347 (-),score=95.84 TRINITY_DN778432_c0_g1_i1:199-1239(-)